MIRGADGGPVNPYTVERYSVIEAFTSPRPYLLRRVARERTSIVITDASSSNPLNSPNPS